MWSSQISQHSVCGIVRRPLNKQSLLWPIMSIYSFCRSVGGRTSAAYQIRRRRGMAKPPSLGISARWLLCKRSLYSITYSTIGCRLPDPGEYILTAQSAEYYARHGRILAVRETRAWSSMTRRVLSCVAFALITVSQASYLTRAPQIGHSARRMCKHDISATLQHFLRIPAINRDHVFSNQVLEWVRVFVALE